MATKIQKILEYFDKDDNMYYPKEGYICLYEGFETDLICFMTENNGQWELGTPDDCICVINGKAKEGYEFAVYKAKKVV